MRLTHLLIFVLSMTIGAAAGARNITSLPSSEECRLDCGPTPNHWAYWCDGDKLAVCVSVEGDGKCCFADGTCWSEENPCT